MMGQTLVSSALLLNAVAADTPHAWAFSTAAGTKFSVTVPSAPKVEACKAMHQCICFTHVFHSSPVTAW